MHVGIISDTHDDLEVVDAAVEYFDDRVDVVVHCGDFVAPFAARPFDADFEFLAVRGNNDGEWGLASTVNSFGTYMGEMGELTLDGNEIAVYHGTSEAIIQALVDSGTYDYVLHGHTHQRVYEDTHGTVRINPGGVAIEVESDDEPPAAVVLETDTGDVSFHDLP